MQGAGDTNRGPQVRFTEEHKWSDHVQDYYPVNPRPRFGFGLPPHAAIAAVLDRGRADYEPALAAIADCHDVLHAIGHHAQRRHVPNPTPTWNNVWFTALDGASLVAFLLARKPKRYLEIGSGNSTRFARHAMKAGHLSTELLSIDPQPRAEIDALCTEVIRSPLETCELSVFQQLEAGDILFFDGSHRVFTNSDVTVFFLEIMPLLKPGVLVHIHDIFLPDDYPPQWTGRLYSEQYILAEQLLCGAPPFKVVLPNYFALADAEMGARIAEIFRSKVGGTDIPLRYPNRVQCPGTSFWVETIPAAPLVAATPARRASRKGTRA
jgi:predicted O-methyltransferase YrrM